jgi:hypothetical protein
LVFPEFTAPALQVVASMDLDETHEVDQPELAKPALSLSQGLGVDVTLWMHLVPCIRYRR